MTRDQTNRVDLRHSVITAASCWLAAMFVFWLHCDNPWWAVISAWVLSSSDFQASSLKAVMRIAGTLAGYLVGLLSTVLTEGNPFAQAIAMFMIGATGTYMRYRGRFSYAWIIGSATAFILLVLDITDPGSVYETGHYRLYEIISGVIAASLCQRVLGPLLGLGVRSAEGNTRPVAPLIVLADEGQVRTIAAIGGLVPVIITLIWSQLSLPSLVQIIITAFVTLDRDVAAARFRVTQRILGCLLGGGIGLLVVEFAITSLFIWSAILFGGIFVLSKLHLGKGPWAYVGTQGGVAFILALVTGNHSPDTIVPVIDRIAGMISGVFIVAAVCFVLRLWQERSAANLHPHSG
jgi:uncharacterized membrane protein YccC